MKKIIVTLIIAALLALGIYMFLDKEPSVNVDSPLAGGNVYTSEKYGIKFTYPDIYVLQESEIGDEHRRHYQIMLVQQEDSALRENSEGPTAITFDIYQNNIDQQSLESWLKGTNDSNFKLSDGMYSSTTVDGVPAIEYRWSGLYEADAVAFRHNGAIVALTVTYITPEDANRKAYSDILKSVDLLAPVQIGKDEAVLYVKGMFPELATFPSDNLPPKRIEAEAYANGWNIGFITEGSGRAGILKAVCYAMTHSKEVNKTGEFTAGQGIAPSKINVATCKPA